MQELLNLDAYRQVLEEIRGTGRSFARFSESAPKGVLVRLDVDYDLEWAVETAKINADLGITACYFVQVASGLYNALLPSNQAAIQMLSALGQDVGLHYYQYEDELNCDRLEKEFSILRTILPETIKSVAWHNPQGKLSELNRSASNLGFTCSYASPYLTGRCYVSDSNLRHMPADISAIVQQCHEPLIQVLLHPFNWVVGGSNMETILHRTVKGKMDFFLKEFDQNSIWKANLADRVISRVRESFAFILPDKDV